MSTGVTWVDASGGSDVLLHFMYKLQVLEVMALAAGQLTIAAAKRGFRLRMSELADSAVAAVHLLLEVRASHVQSRRLLSRSGFWRSDRPQPWYPYVFTSPHEAAESGP